MNTFATHMEEKIEKGKYSEISNEQNNFRIGLNSGIPNLLGIAQIGVLNKCTCFEFFSIPKINKLFVLHTNFIENKSDSISKLSSRNS
jgi:hypothetical protein